MEDKWRDKYNSPPEKHEIVPQSKSIPASGQSPGVNKFANDGSFMAMFRKKMTESQTKTSDSASDSKADDVVTASLSAQTPSSSGTDNSAAAPDSAAAIPTKPSVPSFVGKRRGGKVLKTGAVKKVKKDEEENAGTKDAWAQYLDEVKKYKSQLCGDEDKTRPLVK